MSRRPPRRWNQQSRSQPPRASTDESHTARYKSALSPPARALQNLGITLPETLVGPTAVTFCNEDEVNPLKEVNKVNKTQDFITFKYGIFDKKLLGFDELKQFIALPSKSTLIAQLLGGLVNPLQRLTYSMRYNQTQLALALKAVAEKQEQN